MHGPVLQSGRHNKPPPLPPRLQWPCAHVLCVSRYTPGLSACIYLCWLFICTCHPALCFFHVTYLGALYPCTESSLEFYFQLCNIPPPTPLLLNSSCLSATHGGRGEHPISKHRAEGRARGPAPAT